MTSSRSAFKALCPMSIPQTPACGSAMRDNPPDPKDGNQPSSAPGTRALAAVIDRIIGPNFPIHRNMGQRDLSTLRDPGLVPFFPLEGTEKLISTNQRFHRTTT